MKTPATTHHPEIEWEIDKRDVIDVHGWVKICPAYGESEDGREWIASANIIENHSEEIDVNTIEEG